MTPPDQDAPRLQELLSQFYAGRIARNEVRAGVIDVVLARIGCARVSMWKFEGAEGDLDLLCFAAKTAGGELDVTERRLAQSEYRDYFNALIDRGTFVSVDALNDPALQAMRESYLLPHNVKSLLDAAFMLNGRAYGMVCCEETAATRLACRRRVRASRHRYPARAADVGRRRVGAVEHAVAAAADDRRRTEPCCHTPLRRCHRSGAATSVRA